MSQEKPNSKQTKLFVGNLSFSVEENDLKELFSPYGSVNRVNITKEMKTGQPRGFAYIEMGSPKEAAAAIDALQGKDLGGCPLVVNLARPVLRAKKSMHRSGPRASADEGGTDTDAA